jgi:putative inorganic carbon (HCO3(-)) transporter
MTDLSPSSEGGLAQQAVAARSQGSEFPWQGRLAESWPLVIVIGVLSLALALSVLLVDSRVLIGIAVLLLVGAVMLRIPYLGLLPYVVILYARPEEMGVLPAFLHVERVVALSLVVAVIFSAMAGRRPRLPASRLNWAMIGILAVILAGAPFAFWRGETFATALDFARLCFLYFAIILLVNDLRRVRALLWVILIVWAWHGAAAWTGYHEGTTVYVGEQHVVRAMGRTSRFGGANTLGYLLVVGLCFVVGLFRAERSLLARAALVVIGALCFGGALVTGSRTALVGVVFLALIAVWQSRRKLLVAGVAVALLSIGWLMVPQGLRSRYETIRTYNTEVTWTGRQHGWMVGVRMFLDHPIFGVGAGNFGSARHALYEPSWMNAHSVYTQVAAELGLPGIICFAAFVVLIFRENRRLRRRLDELAPSREVSYARALSLTLDSALAMLLLLGITGHNMYNPNYYLVAALTVVLGRMARDWGEDAEHALRPAEDAAAG